MPFFALALVSSSPWWCLLCIGTDFIKMKSVFVLACALRRKPKSTFLTERLLVSSRLHFNSLVLICADFYKSALN